MGRGTPQHRHPWAHHHRNHIGNGNDIDNGSSDSNKHRQRQATVTAYLHKTWTATTHFEVLQNQTPERLTQPPLRLLVVAPPVTFHNGPPKKNGAMCRQTRYHLIGDRLLWTRQCLFWSHYTGFRQVFLGGASRPAFGRIILVLV